MENNEQISEEQPKKKFNTKKILMILDIIAILGMIGMFFYFKHEKAVFDMLTGNPCHICEFKTHAQCIIVNVSKIFPR